MKKKVSTLVDEALYRRVRLESARRGRQINEIMGAALERYLDDEGVPTGDGGVVAQSWGALAVDPRVVHGVMEEEDGLFDA